MMNMHELPRAEAIRTEDSEVSEWQVLIAAAYKVARAVLRDHHEAEDVAQSAIAAYLCLDRVPEQPQAWVVAVAKNVAVNRIRKQGREDVTDPTLLGLDVCVGDGAEHVIANILSADLLSQLSAEQRHVLELRYTADLTDVDIAHLMGMGASSVRRNLRRALTKLRERVARGDGRFGTNLHEPAPESLVAHGLPPNLSDDSDPEVNECLPDVDREAVSCTAHEAHGSPTAVMGLAPTSSRLVGRAPELVMLETERRKVLASSFRCVLLSGEAGQGKSRLASEFVRRFGRGSVSLLARGYPLGGTAPLGVWAEAFESHLRNLTPEEIERLCGGFLDDLAGLLRSVAAVRGSVPPWEPPRARLLQGLAALLAHLASDSVVVVVLDDMHLADASSWESLHYLARNLRGARVLALIIARTLELKEHPVAGEILLGLEHDGCLRRVPVAPLDREALAELAGHVLGGPAPAATVQWLSDRSRGNAMFAISLLEALVEEGADLADPELRSFPETLAETVSTQLRGLDEPAVATLELLAVVGQRIELSDLMSLSACPLDRLVDILHLLVTSRLVEETEHGRSLTYEIAHPLIAQVISHGIGGARRRVLHRSVARALLAAGRRGAAAPHFVLSASEGDVEAIEALCAAVRQAEQQGSYREALTILHAFVQLLPAGDPRWHDVLHALSWQAEWVVDHRADASAMLGVEAMRELDRMLESSSDPAPRAAVKFRLASFLAWGTGDLEEAEKICRTARDLFEYAGDRRSILLASNELAWIKMLQGELGAAEAASRDVVEEARAVGEASPMAQAVGALGYQALVRGRFDEAETIFEQKVGSAREQTDEYRLVTNLSALALVHAFAGRVEESLVLIDEGRRVCSAAGESVLSAWSTAVQWLAGNFPATVAAASEVLACTPVGLGRRRALALPLAAAAAAEMGLLAEAQRYLDKAKATSGGRYWLFFGDYCSWAEAVLLSHQGRMAEALDVLSGAVRHVMDMGAWPSVALLLYELAETAAVVGDGSRTQRAADRVEEAAVRIDRPLYLGLAAAARGWAELAEGATEAASLSARAAVGLLEPLGTKALLGRTLNLLGRTLVSSNRLEAVEAFGRAAALFGECGASRRREQAIQAVRGLGSSGRRAAASARGAGSLTKREREVAQMAASGHTSREIAEVLFIGQRTVETHLSNAYAKLGVDSRAELVRRVSDLVL